MKLAFLVILRSNSGFLFIGSFCSMCCTAMIRRALHYPGSRGPLAYFICEVISRDMTMLSLNLFSRSSPTKLCKPKTGEYSNFLSQNL
eukprot:UN07695